MVKRKYKDGVWHHRVPDFQLVYCGPQEYVSKKETKRVSQEKMVNVSLFSDDDDETSDKKLEQHNKRKSKL